MRDEIERRQAMADKIRGDHRRSMRRGKLTALLIVTCTVIVGVVALLALRNTWIDSGSVAVPRNADASFGFTATPSDPSTDIVAVSVYEGYVCSSCETFHTQSDAWLTEQLNMGTISVTYYPVTLAIDGNTGERAANAATCVADEAGISAFLDMRALLLTHRAAAGTEPSDQQLIDYAIEAGAPDARGCVEQLTFVPWLTEARDAGVASDIHTLPTVRVEGLNVVKSQDGVELMPGPEQLAIAIEAVK